MDKQSLKMGRRYLCWLLYLTVVQGENLFDHAFKIRIVNVQKVIEVPGSRKGLDNSSLIVMVKRIHEVSFVAV